MLQGCGWTARKGRRASYWKTMGSADATAAALDSCGVSIDCHEASATFLLQF